MSGAPLLILGAGYLGSALAACAAAAGRRVTATTRNPARRAALEAQGVAVLPFELTDGASPAALECLRDEPLEVCCLFTPDAFEARGGVEASCALLCAALSRLHVRRAVLASSTGVYGACAGETVTAETIPEPRDARAARLWAIENAWLAASFPARVLRLAGLYGPGRVIGLERLRRGEPLAGDPQGWLNLIHRSDAVSLLARCLEVDTASAVELGSDGAPVRRIDYYGHLAARCGLARPRFEPEAARRGSSRRCDPASTWARLDWAPSYADYRKGLGASLTGATGG